MRSSHFRFCFVAVLAAGQIFSAVAAWGMADDGRLLARRLRCEYLVDPLSIDVTAARLSWEPVSEQRGDQQTAYQVLVASTPEILAGDRGDLWDTGRVKSDQTIHVQYAGKPLASRRRCFWKVRLWDRDGKVSAWSEPARWSMGLLDPSDWQARWIAMRGSATPRPQSPHNGYHSGWAPSADHTKWVAMDLKKPREVDRVRLDPARPYDWKNTPGFLFPVRFKILLATRPDFADAVVAVDKTQADVPNPGDKPVEYRFTPIRARFVRLEATRLGMRDEGNYGLALAEMAVFAGEQNVARGAKVSSLDAIESGGWSRDRLVDGRTRPDPGSGQPAMRPAVMLRKEFSLAGGPIRRATVYVTGLGLYELRINGRRVGERILAPEWTLYGKRIQYQTHDVTDLLRSGKNAIGAQLGEGWYAGGLFLREAPTNQPLQFLMRLEIERADGQKQVIVTDGAWRATDEGPIRRAGIYFGETYDARREMPGWDRAGFDDTAWQPVHFVDAPAGARLVAQPNEPIRVVRELPPVKLTEPKPGVHVFDFGQNMVGWCRLNVSGPAGTQVTLQHGEMLQPDGTVYTANLRRAKQLGEYTLGGRGEEVWEPHFTYYGFRYVQLTGLPGPVDKNTLLGRVFHSGARDVGTFACSHPLLNQLMHNIVWVQRGNMHGTPTDCPQRDERLGWMGDIQAFSQTAIFNMDMAAFFTKWVPDIRDSQADDGRFPDFAPNHADPNKRFSGVPAWGDAGTVVPWRMYQNYADTRMLAEHFESARRWVDFIHRNNPDLLWLGARGNDYGDWLNGDTLILEGYPKGISEVPKELLATAFWAHSARIVSKMARVLGRDDEAARHAKLHEGIRAAFQRKFVASDGRLQGDTQAGYALALRFDLLEPSMRPRAIAHLVEAIRRYKNHPSTGIQTTHRMLLELSRAGHHDEAYRLVTLRTIPSWGYMIDQGATTIWERWDGYVEGRGFQAPGMNSFNHWALGSVGQWIWNELVGIHPDEKQPGFKHFTIHPRPCGELRWVQGRYDSIRGPIESRWKIADGRFTLQVTIPANTTATVHVPGEDPLKVTEGGRPAGKAPGVRFVETSRGKTVFRVESGKYTFVAPWAGPGA